MNEKAARSRSQTSKLNDTETQAQQERSLPPGRAGQADCECEKQAGTGCQWGEEARLPFAVAVHRMWSRPDLSFL